MIDTLESMIEGKGERQREYLQQVIATKSSSEVEACECCGNRQLSGDQVSNSLPDMSCPSAENCSHVDMWMGDSLGGRL
jgi:hypothetical protein